MILVCLECEGGAVIRGRKLKSRFGKGFGRRGLGTVKRRCGLGDEFYRLAVVLRDHIRLCASIYLVRIQEIVEVWGIWWEEGDAGSLSVLTVFTLAWVST
jgi:hypothetical protein